MGKRRNQPLIDSDSDSESNNDSGSDIDSVRFYIQILSQKIMFQCDATNCCCFQGFEL